MGNQFDARLIWVRREIWTVDEITGAHAKIRYTGDGSETPYEWRIYAPERPLVTGRSKSEQAARNAVRSRVVKLPAKKATDGN